MAEAAIFIIFFVSYGVLYMGKSLNRSVTAQVLDLNNLQCTV